MRLIGLHGRLHSGKDSLWSIIKNHNPNSVRHAFADSMKYSGLEALGLPRDLALADAIKETGQITVTFSMDGQEHEHAIGGREHWQRYGTEAHRSPDLGHSFGNDFWVDNLLPEEPKRQWCSSFMLDDGGPGPQLADIAVITDVRFENEAQRIIDLGGEIWYIDAETRLGPNESTHISERKLPDHLITHTLDNNGLREDVIPAVHSILED